jgi:two-component system, NtrC family, response regulator AtoC
VKLNPFLNVASLSSSMRTLEDEIRCASRIDASVMITGESGVGKRFAADLIHHMSSRRRAPFVVVNARDFELAERGLLQTAAQGTLLIQEIESLTPKAQAQLLQSIENMLTDRKSTRLMTATAIHLFDRVEKGEFREDLFYRLNVIHLVIPPLRERREDIPLMFDHYLSLYTHTQPPQLSSAARQRLLEYPWPGNIAELDSVTKKLSTQELPDVIEPEHLPCPIGE